MAGKTVRSQRCSLPKKLRKPAGTPIISTNCSVSLSKKGMVQVSGLLQNGRYQSRQFVPCYTKDEFLANMLEEQGVNQALFARIAVALFEKTCQIKRIRAGRKADCRAWQKMVDQYEAALQNKEEK